MNHEEEHKDEHSVEVDVTGLVVTAEELGQTLELHGLPHRETAEEQQGEIENNDDVENALDEVILARAMNEQMLYLQPNISVGGHGADVQELFDKMA